MGKAIMLQGTGSYVGKSVLVTALCRIFAQDGFRVAPFKSQNMALNTAVTKNHKEIGRAQYLQAQAAKLEPTVEMNPILLKPCTDTDSEVIVAGEPVGQMSAQEYIAYKPQLLTILQRSLEQLKSTYDIVVIEGAGSPAEVNLRSHDIANMTVAKLADAPVFLVADIDLGGVFAYVYGTLKLLLPEERARIQGVIVNKFRGQAERFSEGVGILEELVGLPVAGVLPFIEDLDLPEEDSIPERKLTGDGESALRIGVIHFHQISNFTDFDPLQRTPGVQLNYLKPGENLAGYDLLILPGTQNPAADLGYLVETGSVQKIQQAAEQGIPLLAVGGGLQILGQIVSAERALDMQFLPDVGARRVAGTIMSSLGLLNGCQGLEISGYQLESAYPAAQKAWITFDDGGDEGFVSSDGLVLGTMLHGIFDQQEFRNRFLQNIASFAEQRRQKNLTEPRFELGYDLDHTLDRLATTVRSNLDLTLLYQAMDLEKRR